jgi:regulatory protein
VRDRTVAELRAFLERRGVRAVAVDAAIEVLSGVGYLDDARYARRFAEDRRALQSWGRERIAGDLERRGVSRELIEEALADRGREAELASATTLLRERFPGAPMDDRERDRAWRVLVRRGYDPELAYEAVRARERAA